MRLFVSDLQCWQRYKNNESVTLEDCLKQLRRQEPVTPALLAGRKLHQALENAQYGESGPELFGQSVLQYKGYTFFIHCDIDLVVPEVRELKGEMEIATSIGPVTLVGVVDSIDVSISDYKLSGRFDAELLAESYQWRCYLQMFERHRFDYKVFIGDEIKDKEWIIRDYHELSFYRYPGMEADVQREVEGCARFMREQMIERRAA